MDATIRRDLIAHLDTTPYPTPVSAVATWDPADPLAVRIAFRSDVNGWVTWDIARDLLHAGLEVATNTHPAGAGDVQIGPATDTPTGPVAIALSSPSGDAVFRFRRAPLAELLTATYLVVPLDEESRVVEVALDVTLSALAEHDAA